MSPLGRPIALAQTTLLYKDMLNYTHAHYTHTAYRLMSNRKIETFVSSSVNKRYEAMAINLVQEGLLLTKFWDNANYVISYYTKHSKGKFTV